MKNRIVIALFAIGALMLLFFSTREQSEASSSVSSTILKTTPLPEVYDLKKQDLPLPKTLPNGLGGYKNGNGNGKDSKVKLLPLIEKAQKVLEKLPQLEYSYKEEITPKKKGKKEKTKKKQTINYDLAFAVTHLESGEVEVVKIPHTDAKKATTTVPLRKGEFTLSYDKWNGCNTPYEVKKPDGYAVLALRCLIANGNTMESLVYTPYTKDIDTPELRASGYSYLQKKLVDAAVDLKKQGVKSAAFPGEYASDAVPMSVAFRLAIIEHIEPSLLGKIPIEELVNKVLVIVAANQGDSYIASMSKAGAYGQFQFIPKTYKEIVKQYPSAKLNPDFREGMRDHLNAAKASLLLFDSDLSVAKPPLNLALRTDPHELALYLAASYNGGAPRAVRAIKKGGFKNGTWRKLLLSETRNYLEKIEEVNRVIK